VKVEFQGCFPWQANEVQVASKVARALSSANLRTRGASFLLSHALDEACVGFLPAVASALYIPPDLVTWTDYGVWSFMTASGQLDFLPNSTWPAWERIGKMFARGVWARERLREPCEYSAILSESEEVYGTYEPRNAKAWCRAGRSNSASASAIGQDWMARVDGDVLISSLTIPGTHDSAAYTLAWPFVQTQLMDIKTQLDSGIRYFDLRCGIRDDEAEMVHGTAYLGLKLSEVLDTLCHWLKSHESEALIVQIKQDRKPERSTVHFAHAVWKCIAKHSERWRTANTTPTLAELRGKIQLLRRYDGPSLRAYGIDVTGWQDNPSKPFTIYGKNSVNITIQDHYSFSDPESLPSLIVTKGGDVAELLNRAAADPEDSHWYINFTSAYEFNLLYQLPPREVAIGGYWAFRWEPGMNPRLRNYLFEHEGKRRYGIVAMDFPERGTDDLIEGLIASNFGRKDKVSRLSWMLLLDILVLLLLASTLSFGTRFVLCTR
jgi:1-phosphatidylinositol phosphodiesterase